MATSKDVANYFLSCVREDVGDVITHLKLQKLVYYAQGFCLTLTGEPLFEEQICAWDHGPVVPDLYQEFRQYGPAPIPPVVEGSADKYFTADQLEILKDVQDLYGQFSAWKLRNLTHEEPTWNNAYPNGEITKEAMKDYFKELVE